MKKVSLNNNDNNSVEKQYPDDSLRKGLFNKNFMLLWIGQLVSAFGNAIQYIALMWWVLEVTKSPAVLGNVFALAVLPRVILGPIAGVVVDRVNRKWIIVLADLFRGVIIVWMGLMALKGTLQVWQLYVIALLISFAGAFFDPAIGSSIPNLVADKHLTRANSLYSMGSQASNIVGPGVAGILIAVAGAPLVFLLNGITYFFSGISEMFISMCSSHNGGITLKSTIDDLKEGFYFIVRQGYMIKMFITFAALNFFISPIDVILPKYVKSDLGYGAGEFGILMALFSVGFVVGGGILSISPEIKQKHIPIIWGIVGVSSLVVIFTLIPTLWYIYTISFVMGVLLALVNILINVFIQKVVPDEKRGRVFSVMGTLSGGLQPISLALVGYTLSIISVRMLTIVMGISSAFFGLFLYTIPNIKEIFTTKAQ